MRLMPFFSVHPRVPLLTVLVTLLLVTGLPRAAGAGGDPLFTLWPLVDYRSSAAVDYSSLHLLGPLFKYETRADETETALRPLWYSAGTGDGLGFTEILYPLLRSDSDPRRSRTVAFGLFHRDRGGEEEDGTRLTLFPFLFYQSDTPEEEGYLAVWPLGGTLRDRLFRDSISFALWPLYVATEKDGTYVTNLPWPFFARISGENESGFKLWPLYGRARKDGVYRKEMFLWPVGFRYDLALDSDNPERIRSVFPLYVSHHSPREETIHWLWPLFRHYENFEQGYRELDAPWPLVRIGDGEGRRARRFLPLYADERRPDQRKRWFLWPVYKIEEVETTEYARRRDRVLFFLYSDTREVVPELSERRLHRISLWPLFTYERKGRVRSFRSLSLLEPFFPDNEGFARNWSPLWWVYQQRWDADGNRLVTLLWNLYWQERRGPDIHHELFPLWRYRREGEERDMVLLKGLVGMHRAGAERSLRLLWLPWPIPLGERKADD